MTIPPLLADFLTDLALRPDMTLRNVLMALGGGVVGMGATAFICFLSFKAVHVKKVPPRLLLFLSLLGGFVAGWLVWSWAAGTGFGPGPGGGVVGGTATSKGGLATTIREPAPVTAPKENTETLRIVIMRSKDYQADSKYFLVEGRAPARNLQETLLFLKERQQKQPDLKTVEIVIYQDSMAAEALGLVAGLEEAVRPLGLTLKTHKPGVPSP